MMRTVESASSPTPHATVATRQIRRKPGTLSHSTSHDSLGIRPRRSSSGRVNRMASGRLVASDPRNHRPLTPVIQPSLASRNRSLPVSMETSVETISMVRM